MKQTPKRKLHPIIMLVYIPRTIGYLFVFAMITSVMYERDYSITLWIFLILQCFLWPHILFLISSYSKKPKLVEFWFLSADSFFFGVWLAIINFNPWVVMVLLVTSMMGNMSLYGISLCLRCLVGLILGALISGFFTDYQFILNSSKVTIITCAMSIFIYCVVTAIVIYSRGEQLRNIKKSLAVANEKITQFDKIVKAASSNLEFNSVMETIIPVLRNTFDFDTMAIQLADEEQKKLYFFAIYGRYITQRYLNEMASIEVSLQQNDSISYTVYAEQEPIYFARVTNDMEKLKKDKEIFEIKPFLSLLSIPIVIKSKSIGVINFMSHYAYSNLNHEQLETVQQLVSQISMIIYTAVQFQKKQQRINEITAENKLMREKIDNVGCFFSSQIADQIKSEDDSAMLTVNRRRITVFYSKIVNYNMLKNSIEAEDYVNIINDYIESMAKIIHHFGGAIDFFESGNLMVVFGDKQTKNVINDAMDCVNMARAMQEKILELNEKWKNDGLAIAIELAMAISSGFCSIGFFGDIEHRKYSVVGNNISAVKEMLEKASDNQILISYETFLLVKESFSCSQVGDLNLSWMKHPIIIYSVEGDYS